MGGGVERSSITSPKIHHYYTHIHTFTYHRCIRNITLINAKILVYWYFRGKLQWYNNKRFTGFSTRCIIKVTFVTRMDFIHIFTQNFICYYIEFHLYYSNRNIIHTGWFFWQDIIRNTRVFSFSFCIYVYLFF